MILKGIQATWSIQWKVCPLPLVDIFITINPTVPFRYITFVYVLFFSTLRMAVQHLQGWTGEYLCLICWNQKQVSSSFCTDDNIVMSTEICSKIYTLLAYLSAFKLGNRDTLSSQFKYITIQQRKRDQPKQDGWNEIITVLYGPYFGDIGGRNAAER